MLTPMVLCIIILSKIMHNSFRDPSNLATQILVIHIFLLKGNGWSVSHFTYPLNMPTR